MHKFTNIFTQEELSFFINEYNNAPKEDLHVDEILGRVLVHNLIFPQEIMQKVLDLANSISDIELETGNGAMLTTYSNKYGKPNLPPHFDGDTTDLIINFQLDSNTSWDLGLDMSLHTLEDNSALAFNPNENVHWRPHKEFLDGEYVTMVFFRFRNAIQESDYSHKAYTKRHPIFNEVRAFRDSI